MAMLCVNSVNQSFIRVLGINFVFKCSQYSRYSSDYNSKFRALEACAPAPCPRFCPWCRGRAPVGGPSPPEAENFTINLQQTFRDFFTINVYLTN